MANIVIFDEQTGFVKGYLESVSSPDYARRTDVVISPDLSRVSAFPWKYWRHDRGSIVLAPQIERDAIDQVEADARQAALDLAASAKQKLSGLGFTDQEIGLILNG